MKSKIFYLILLVQLSLISCSDKSDDSNSITGPQPSVSTDPAVRDTSLDLVVIPGWFYENIKTERLSQTNESITRDSEPFCSSCWKSNTYAEVTFSPNIGRMQCLSGAEVVAKPLGTPGIPKFTETCIGKSTLMREFTVEANGNSGTALAGSVIRFNTKWLGRIISLSPLSSAAYDVRFIMRDLTEGKVKIDQSLAKNSVQGEFKITAIKGVPIIIPLPNWSKDETEDERHAFPIPLIAGHTYRIQLTLTLTTKTDGLGGAISTFGIPGLNVGFGAFDDVGFIEFTNVELDIGN